MTIAAIEYRGRPVSYRVGTSDEEAMRGVLDAECYLTPGFDVVRGERWLDLGANIGMFSVFCEARGAHAEAYEPDEGCFELLKRNTLHTLCTKAFVSDQKDPFLPLFVSPKTRSHWRGTFLPVEQFEPIGYVDNVYMGTCNQHPSGEKVFTGAYVIAAGPGSSKIEYVASILDDLWADREFHRPDTTDTLQSFYEGLRQQSGLGTFMAAQIVADCKYTPVLADTDDWWTWAAPGPGSLKGMNRLVGRPPGDPLAA